MSIRLLHSHFWPMDPERESIFKQSLEGAGYEVKVVYSIDEADINIQCSFCDDQAERMHLQGLKGEGPLNVFYTGEAVHADRVRNHIAVSFDREENEYMFRQPLYVAYVSGPEAVARGKWKEAEFSCSMVCSHFNPGHYRSSRQLSPRREFAEFLHSKQALRCAGRAFGPEFNPETIGPDADSKFEFIGKSLFHAAFENCVMPGYITEKIVHGFVANTIPIYWGDPDVVKDFNRNSFLRVDDYSSFEDLWEVMKSIHADPSISRGIIESDRFSEGVPPDCWSRDRLAHWVVSSLEKHRAGTL